MTRVAVRVAALLHGYTGGRAALSAEGGTVGEVLADLDRQYPGLRFRLVDEQGRLRRHVRLFVNEADARDLSTPLSVGDELYVVGALSGG